MDFFVVKKTLEKSHKTVRLPKERPEFKMQNLMMRMLDTYKNFKELCHISICTQI